MIFKAVISSQTEPELGQATIPFPIPNSEYDHTINLLENMGIGSPTAQDCRVDEVNSTYPILNRLVAQSVNVEELDYLAKRLDSFCADENAQFQAMAEKLDLTDIRDFINLTFCCQQATVITDFSDLERIGRAHYMNVNGGCARPEELEDLDGEETARLLISDGEGVITPYGVVYDNGMKLEPLYDGRHFPAYLYKPPLMVLEVNPDPAGTAAGYLYLPCPDRQLQRTLLRAEQGQEGFRMEVTMDESPSEVSNLVNPTRDSLNALCQAIEPLDSGQREKLAAVVLMTKAESANEVRQLAEIWGPRAIPAKGGSRGERRSSKMSELCRLRQSKRYGACDDADQFDFVPKSDSPMADGFEKLNRLAGLADTMDLEAQKVFAGGLRAESINGLDDVLRVASSLSQYEFIEGVTTDKELGGWLVEHGKAGVKFPEESCNICQELS